MKKKKSVFNSKGKIMSNSILMSYGESSLKKRFFLFFILLISMLTLPTLASILIIDDFSEAQSVGSNQNSFATDAGILGGERHVETNSYASVEIDTSVPNQAVLDSTPGVPYYAYVNLRYDGIGSNTYGLNNMDLTDGGKYSGFQLSVTEIGNSGGDFYIIVGQENQASTISALLLQADTIFLPFSDFELASATSPITKVDFTNVGYIELYTWVKPGETTVIGSFEIVPEPTTLLLVGLGGLMVRRKK